MKPDVSKRQLRGPTKAADRQRTQDAEAIAQTFVEGLADALSGKSVDLIIDVIRAVARRLACWLVARAGEQRCVGILTGAMAHACPGWFRETDEAKAAAEALFRSAA